MQSFQNTLFWFLTEFVDILSHVVNWFSKLYFSSFRYFYTRLIGHLNLLCQRLRNLFRKRNNLQFHMTKCSRVSRNEISTFKITPKAQQFIDQSLKIYKFSIIFVKIIPIVLIKRLQYCKLLSSGHFITIIIRNPLHRFPLSPLPHY